MNLSPYYDLIPKGKMENLRFREELLRGAAGDKEYQRELKTMCARDVLFFCNAFVWTYDPRKEPSTLPFITYPYQDECILDIVAALGNNDLLIEKSRDMGATWFCLLPLYWSFTFEEMKTYLVVSRKEDLVDKTEDPDCLFWKLDFIHECLPTWMRSNMNRQRLHFYNQDTGATIDGSSTTGDVGRGGRRTAVFLDEFASVDDGHAVLRATRDMTNCRFFNSTPKGTHNAFYAMRQTGIAKVRAHWSQHPEKAAGAYHYEGGAFRYEDVGFIYAEDFEPVADGKFRSPWYDLQCKRAAHPQEIAQELDIDYLGSDFQFFDPEKIGQHRSKYMRTPYSRGEVICDEDAVVVKSFSESRNGNMYLWLYLDARVCPPAGRRYSIGCDIATGTGASNSVASVSDYETGEKVAEVVEAFYTPDRFAKLVVALARWFNDAFLIWEANGPGRVFGDVVVRVGYRNIFYRRNNEQSVMPSVSDYPGWVSTQDSKVSLLGDYRRALVDGEFVNRSEMSLAECLSYIYTQGGSVVHSGSLNKEDPSGANANHGDRVIADALSWRGVKMFGNRSESKRKEVTVLEGSFLSRRNERVRERMLTEKTWNRPRRLV